jgi:hypothetical protein
MRSGAISEPAFYSIWAEQDEKTSRIMAQIGHDRPVCILKYDREMVNMVTDEVVAVEFTKTPETTRALSNLVGLQITVQAEHEARYDA